MDGPEENANLQLFVTALNISLELTFDWFSSSVLLYDKYTRGSKTFIISGCRWCDKWQSSKTKPKHKSLSAGSINGNVRCNMQQ